MNVIEDILQDGLIDVSTVENVPESKEIALAFSDIMGGLETAAAED